MCLKISDWKSEHLKDCLAAFESNLPDYFAAHEQQEFHDFLDKLANQEFDPESLRYWCVMIGNNVVGCGGVWINLKEKDKPATLIWGLIERRYHRQGLGTELLKHRIEWLKGLSQRLLLDTTTDSFPFYQKQGFIQTGFKKDGYEPGLDMILAELSI